MPSVLDILYDLTKQISNTAVHDLNDVHINETERLILSLGLAFIPQQESNPNWDLNDNFTKFQRDVRIKHFFLSNESYEDKSLEGQLHKIVNKQKSLDEKILGFEPPPASPNVESFLHDVKLNLENIVLKSNNNSSYHNNNSNYVARTLKSAIKALYNRNDIVIQEADKKLGTTVMDRREYLRLALGPDQLGDNEKYLPLLSAPLLEPIKYALLEILKNQTWLSTKEVCKLTTDLCYHMTDELVKCCPMFYYPKVHKLLNPNDKLSLRPLCSSPKFITYNTSKYLDLSTQEILRRMPTHVRNSADMIICIEDTVLPDGGFLVKADVCTLYPSIIIQDGLLSMRWCLEFYRFDSKRIDFLLKLAEWVLQNNYVSFNGHIFLQIKGVAMGTPFAVVFSCMHLFKIETESFQIFYNSSRITPDSIKLYKRFIDDYNFWACDYYSAKHLMEILNSRRESINIEYVIDDKSTEFLDIKIYKGERYYREGILDVSAFFKESNKFLFLPPNSFHQPSVFRAWIVEFLNRLRLLCCNDSDFEVVTKFFHERLVARGYDKILLDQYFSCVSSRDSMLHKVRENYTKWFNNVSEIEIIDQPVRFHLTYTKDTMIQLQKIKTALKTDIITNGDHLAKLIFGDSSHALFSISNATNCKKLLVSNITSADTPDDELFNI